MKKLIPILIILLVVTSCSTFKNVTDHETKDETTNNEIPDKPGEPPSNDTDDSSEKPSDETTTTEKTNNNENQNNSNNNNTIDTRPNGCSTEMDIALDDMEALLGIATMRELYGSADEEELPANMIDGLYDIFKTWYSNSISSKLKSAESDETILDCTMVEFNSWHKYSQLLGIEESFTDEIYNAYESIAKGMNNAVDEAAKKCATQHDFSQIGVMFYYLAQSQLMGLDISDYGVYSQYDIYDKMVSVTKLELDFDSQFELTDEGEMAALARVQSSKIPLTLVYEELPEMVWKGSGPLDYVQFIIPDDDGTITISTTDSTFEVVASWFTYPTPQVGCTHCGQDDQEEESEIHPSIKMVINPGNPSEKIEIKDEDFSMTIPFAFGWFAMFSAMHEQDYVNLTEPFISLPPVVEGILIDDWDMGGPGLKVIARKVYDGSGADGIDEMTTLDLIHVPN